MSGTTEFEALFNHATIGIIVSNSQRKIINFNPSAESQFGYSKNEVIGQSLEILLPDQFRKFHETLRNNFYTHPSPRRMGEGRDLYGRKKGGAEFPIEISLGYYSNNGQHYVIAFSIDISSRKKSEEMVLNQRDELKRVTTEIKLLNEELEQKVKARTTMLIETLNQLERSREELSRSLENEKNLNELKSRFVTTASHEFRTPLSTILSSAYLLEKYNDTQEVEKRKKHLRHIKDAVADMKDILEDFLSLGKLEEGLVRANTVTESVTVFIQYLQGIIDENLTVAEMEMGFKKQFGVNMQVYRKSGNVWIETTLTDKWTLKKQNQEGEQMSKPNVSGKATSSGISFYDENNPPGQETE